MAREPDTPLRLGRTTDACATAAPCPERIAARQLGEMAAMINRVSQPDASMVQRVVEATAWIEAP